MTKMDDYWTDEPAQMFCVICGKIKDNMIFRGRVMCLECRTSANDDKAKAQQVADAIRSLDPLEE